MTPPVCPPTAAARKIGATVVKGTHTGVAGVGVGLGVTVPFNSPLLLDVSLLLTLELVDAMLPPVLSVPEGNTEVLLLSVPVTAEVTPDVTPDVTPEVEPDVTPDLEPDVIADEITTP